MYGFKGLYGLGNGHLLWLWNSLSGVSALVGLVLEAFPLGDLDSC